MLLSLSTLPPSLAHLGQELLQLLCCLPDVPRPARAHLLGHLAHCVLQELGHLQASLQPPLQLLLHTDSTNSTQVEHACFTHTKGLH